VKEDDDLSATPSDSRDEQRAPELVERSEAGEGAGEDEVVWAELVPEPPALWPVFMIVVGAIFGGVVLSTLGLIAVAIASGDFQKLADPHGRIEWITQLTASRWGLVILLLPGQLVFAATAVAAALMSRDPWHQRLGFRSGRLPAWTWPFFLAGTPVIGTAAARLISAVADEPSEQLKLLQQLVQFDSLGVLVTLLLLVSVLPGVAEELLFRGYMQRRLLTRLHPLMAIGICSVFFAAAHMDPMQAIGVLPLGIWLGIIAWRADSIWPAILGHIGNNGYAIVMSKVVGIAPDAERAAPAVAVAVIIIAGISLLSFAAAIAALVIWGGKQERVEQEPAVAP
jgi:uncharacterized protein